ncbi:MAG: CoxG family protein [Haloferacaceae archaeon]
MRLEETGTFSVEASAEDALAYLTDVEAVPHCLPGEIHDVEPREDGGVTVEMTASYAGASEEIRVRFYVDAVDEDAGCVQYTGNGLASRAKVDLDGEFHLQEDGDQLQVEWRGGADVGGILSSLNRGVASVAVREKLGETAENVQQELQRRGAN